MSSALKRRLNLLEIRVATVAAPVIFRYGWLRRLPKDFIGEKHVVIVSREPTQSSNIEWCRFEERPGPASHGGDRSFTVYCAE
jgi:hypothetical protein